MHNIRKIEDYIIRVGVSDRKLTMFESVYPISSGMSYNSYAIIDEKTAVIDTVDKHCGKQFFENIEYVLNGRTLDYLIVQHVEPDHSALIFDVLNKYPNAEIVCSAKASEMIKQFFDVDENCNFKIIKENDKLLLGKHELQFMTAPMVHWPEVIVTYDSETKTLFSADAFGSFGAVNGNISDRELEICEEYINETRRYYSNIVGKYGIQVQALLKKASNLEIKRICPLHGLIIEQNIDLFIEKYNKWSKYEPEENGVVIAYSSIYGGTENCVEILATKLAEHSVKNIKMFDVSMTHNSYILAEMFKYSNVVIGANTYNNGIFTPMENLLNLIVSHGLKNRKYFVIQNGSWCANCGCKIVEELSKLGTVSENLLTIKSTLSKTQEGEMNQLVEDILSSLNS